MWAERLRKLGAAVFWLIIWQLLSLLVGNKVLLVGPYETALALIKMLPDGKFWLSALASGVRIFAGFLSGALLGVLMAALSYRWRLMRELFSPLIGALKAVPVASFVILALIWFGSGLLGFFVTLIVTLPILYLNALEGLDSADAKLLEVKKVYKMGLFPSIKGIYFPEIYPYLKSALELSVGMSWKSGIAAEVIGQPLGTLGNELYRAKILLETDRLLAVTVAAVFLSWCMGKLVIRAFSLLKR